MDLLLITGENKSLYVYIKDFNRFMCNKKKCRTKIHFFRYCLECFSSEGVLIENKRTCSKINGKQNVKLKCSSIGFKNQFKQLAVPFKIYADFECNMKRLKSNDKSVASYTKKHQDRIPCSFAYKYVCIDDKFSKPVVLYRGKNGINKSINVIFKKYDYCKKIIK